MGSNLPSSFTRSSGGGMVSPPSVPSQQKQAARQPEPPPKIQKPSSESSNLPLFVAAVALIIALASLYGAFVADRPLSAAQKEQLTGIANDLRALQNREIRMSAPLQATVYINKSYPIKDMFPETFEIPLEFVIPIDTQMIAVSTTGQPVAFRVQENVPIKAMIPINSAKAFGISSIQISKELPLEAVWSADIKVRAAYGQDLNGIIDKLDALSGGSQAAGNTG